MNFVPENLLNKKYKCIHCNSMNNIDWLKDRGGEVNSFHHPNGGIMVRTSLGENCPKCQGLNLIELPHISKKGNFYLFGDEAAREFDNDARLFSYSLVGCSEKFLIEIEKRLYEIKSKFLPDINPEDWRIHMKDLWSGSNRAKHVYFKDITQEEVKVLLKEIEELFKEFGQKIYKVNISLAGSTSEKKGIRKLTDHIKNEAYILVVLNTIDLVTKHGLEPHFIFDAEKDSKSEKVIQKWASDSFSKSSSNMLYCFMTHSIPVEEPVFVQPGSRPLLELADILCYVVARHNDKFYKKEKADIDCSMFGEVEYYTFVEKGEYLESKVSNKYPWKLFRNQ